jgi:hypothetical protein
VIVLTPSYNLLPLGGVCVKLAGGSLVISSSGCKGRYLVVERGSGVYASGKPLERAGGLVVYVASGPPRRYELAGGAMRVEDGMDLFRGFVKRGLWRELARSFYAAVSAYAARCDYCTAYIEARLAKWPIHSIPPGLFVGAVRLDKKYRAVVISLPGHSGAFKCALLKLFDKATVVHDVRLGSAIDVPLDVYLPLAARAGARKRAEKPPRDRRSLLLRPAFRVLAQ